MEFNYRNVFEVGVCNKRLLSLHVLYELQSVCVRGRPPPHRLFLCSFSCRLPRLEGFFATTVHGELLLLQQSRVGRKSEENHNIPTVGIVADCQSVRWHGV